MSDFRLSFNINLDKEGIWDERHYRPNWSGTNGVLGFTTANFIPYGFPVLCGGLDDSTKLGWWICVNKNDLSNPASWWKPPAADQSLNKADSVEFESLETNFLKFSDYTENTLSVIMEITPPSTMYGLQPSETGGVNGLVLDSGKLYYIINSSPGHNLVFYHNYEGTGNLNLPNGEDLVIKPNCGALFYQRPATMNPYGKVVCIGTVGGINITANETKLVGLATSDPDPIAENDTALVAFQKVQAQIGIRAPLESPVFTGTPQVPLNPINANSPLSKGYFDNQLFALNWKYSCRASTTGALPGYTASGDFQTLTATGNGALPAQDGVTLIVGDRLLVKNEAGANRTNHGSFIVSQIGDAGTPWILTRYQDSNTDERLLAATYRVREGAVEGNKAYAVNISPITLGTTEITFAQVAGAGQYTNGAGLLLAGNVFSPDFASNAEQIAGTSTVKVSTPASVKAQIGDEKKNYEKDISLVSGTQYDNILPIKLKSGEVTAASGAGISNIRYATSYAATYATLSSALPLTVSAGNLYIKFDYTTVGELAGSITISGKDS